MKTRSVFILSLALNLALIGWVAGRVGRARGDVVAEERSVAPASQPPAEASSALPGSAAEVAIAYQTNRFHWRQMETNDLVQLAANLRAVGCPEKTVRDLVLARARRALDQLSAVQPALPFWTTGRQREHAERLIELENLAVAKRICTEVEGALGGGAFPENARSRHDLVEQALMRFVCGPMPEENYWQLQMTFARAEARSEEVNVRSRGVLLAEDEQALERAKQLFQRELRAVLSPAEFEEFTARTGFLEFANDVCLAATDLSLAEIRQIGLLRGRHIVAGLEGSPDGGPKLSDEAEERFQTELRQALGETRYAQFQRAADHDFRALFELGRENQLAPEAAVSVYELRRATAQEVATVRADASVPEFERAQRLARIQSQTQEAVLKILGATASGQYLGSGGAWVTNVTRL